MAIGLSENSRRVDRTDQEIDEECGSGNPGSEFEITDGIVARAERFSCLARTFTAI